MSNMVELLAPVGCEENFYAAINYGANAIYIGLSDFSARKNAGNFTIDKLAYYVAYAHLFNVKVYVAVNTVIKNSELGRYFDCIKNAYKLGVDAFIVQDLLLGRELKARFPKIVLHLSTQAGINNVDGAKQALSYGFRRVILARETPISEIRKITQIIETEVFIHGALCTCFSGHCYFSSFIGGKSGNRGSCRQPCRKLYKYQGIGIKDDFRYALSLSDLALPKRIDELISCGVKSFKIEGRMRSFEYVCTACDFYRELIDGNFNRVKFDNLKRCYNRGDYTEGLSFGQQKTLISDKIQNHAGVVVGKISGISKNRLMLSSLKHKLAVGDCFKILSNGYEIGNAFTVDEGGKPIVKYSQKAQIGSEIAITKDAELAERLKAKRMLHEVKVVFYARVGERLKLTVNDKVYESDFVALQSINSALTKSEVKENLRKVDVYPFSVIPSCDITNDIFIPKKELNALRAKAYNKYFYSYLSCSEIFDENLDLISENKNDYEFVCEDNCKGITVISDEFLFNLANVSNLVFCPADYNDRNSYQRFFEQTKNCKAKKYLYVPPILNELDEQIIKDNCDDFDGLYCESLSGLFLAKRLKKLFFGGVELNITNAISYNQLKCDGAQEIALSKELSASEIVDCSGWVLTLGMIKVMTLAYCPFGKKCGECNRSNSFTLKDEGGREFFVRRYKLSECRFEVYNCNFLKSKYNFNKQIFDFTLLNKNEANNLMSNYLLAKDVPITRGFTIGNLAKGVE